MITDITPLLGKVHNCDCVEFMKKLPDKCVDLVLTDPPYGINCQSNSRAAKLPKILGDSTMDHRAFFQEFRRILKSDTVAISFCSWKNYHAEYSQMADLFDIKNVLVWHKMGGGIGDLEHSFFTDYELAIVAHNGMCKIRGKRDGSVWCHGKVNPHDMVHPTEKPIGLMARLITAFSDEGDVVFDPFSGSGPAMIAAEANRRRWMGCELEPKYCEIANKRIDAERNQLKMF